MSMKLVSKVCVCAYFSIYIIVHCAFTTDVLSTRDVNTATILPGQLEIESLPQGMPTTNTHTHTHTHSLTSCR